MDPRISQSADSLLASRDAALEKTRPLVERHQDERYIAIALTTLTEVQMQELIRYRLNLRNIERLAGYPNVELPRAPAFV
ncbi:hypothetical protein [Paraburkholderia sediminicola]|uniref:hypothetical protein n=1 Tax=Paraburkholderia sediminicola TaxID=458836 RepID=UPI0038B9A6D6